MARKQPMGEMRLAFSGTAAEAVAEVAGERLPRSRGSSRRKGLVKAMVRLDPRHIEGLKREAIRRAEASTSNRLDLSEIVRECLDHWLKKVGKD